MSWVSSLAPAPSFPQVPPAENCLFDAFGNTQHDDRFELANYAASNNTSQASPCSTLRIRACNTQKKLHEPANLANLLMHASWRSSRVKPKHVYMYIYSYQLSSNHTLWKILSLDDAWRRSKPPALLIGRYCQLFHVSCGGNLPHHRTPKQSCLASQDPFLGVCC